MIVPKIPANSPPGSVTLPDSPPTTAAPARQDAMSPEPYPPAPDSVANPHALQLPAVKQATSKEVRGEVPAAPERTFETTHFASLFARVLDYRGKLPQVQSHADYRHWMRSPNRDLDEYAYDMMREFTATVTRMGVEEGLPSLPADNGVLFERALVYASLKELDAPKQAFAAIKRSAEQVVETFDALASAIVHDRSAIPQAKAAFIQAWAAHLQPAKAFEAECDRCDPLLEDVRSTWRMLNEHFLAKRGRVSNQRDACAELFSAGWSYFWQIMPQWQKHVPALKLDMKDTEDQHDFMNLLECAYVPQLDNHVDLVAACEAAKKGADALLRMGDALARGEFEIAREHAQTFQPQLTDFLQHYRSYEKDSEPRDFVLPELGIYLDAPSLRAFLVDNTSMRLPAETSDAVLEALHDRDLSRIYKDIRESLAKEPPDFSDAYYFLDSCKDWLARTGTTDAKAVRDTLDLEPLRKKYYRDEAAAVDFYEICARLVADLDPVLFNKLDLQRYAGSPVNKLADAMTTTGRVVFMTMLPAIRNRVQIGPQLVEACIAFEQENMRHALSMRNGTLGVTDQWLNDARPFLNGTTPKDRHAAAVAYLLVRPSWLGESVCPEIIQDSLETLQSASKKLKAQLVFSVAEEFFIREAREKHVPITSADRITLQRDLSSTLDKVFYRVDYEQATSLILRRLKDIAAARQQTVTPNLDGLSEAFDSVRGDLADERHPIAIQKRAIVTTTVARILRRENIEGPNSPWLSRVAEDVAPLRPWVDVDWRVHGSYYAPRLG